MYRLEFKKLRKLIDATEIGGIPPPESSQAQTSMGIPRTSENGAALVAAGEHLPMQFGAVSDKDASKLADISATHAPPLSRAENLLSGFPKGSTSLLHPQPFNKCGDGPLALAWFSLTICALIAIFGYALGLRWQHGFSRVRSPQIKSNACKIGEAVGKACIAAVFALPMLLSMLFTRMASIPPFMITFLYEAVFYGRTYYHNMLKAQLLGRSRLMGFVIQAILPALDAPEQLREAFPIENILYSPTFHSMPSTAWGLWAPATLYETCLAEKWCRQLLNESKDLVEVMEPPQEDAEHLLDDVDINPSLPFASKQALREILLQKKVLSYYPGKLTEVEVRLDLRSGFTPQAAAPRALGPAQTSILTSWIKGQVMLGLYEKASTSCQWASCLHIAPTWETVPGPMGTTPKLKKIKICGDYRAVNEHSSSRTFNSGY